MPPQDYAHTCLTFLILIGTNLDQGQGFIISRDWIYQLIAGVGNFRDYLLLLPPLFFSLINPHPCPLLLANLNFLPHLETTFRST